MNNFTFLCGFLLFSSYTAEAQRPVSTAIQKRKVLLEQYTGIHCPTCPNGHRIADSLKAVKPANSLFLVNIHHGALASPNVLEPDFRTADGNTIAAFSGTNVTTYPSGSINRHRFGGNSGFAVSPAQWSAYIDSVQAENSPYNIALDATLDVVTRKLNVKVQVGGHPFAPVAYNVNMNVLLLEEQIYGPQSGSLLYPSRINPIDSSYQHNYVLRKDLSYPSVYGGTGQTYGPNFSQIYQDYYYTVPTQYANNAAALGNLRLVAFMTEGDTNVITAATGPITLTGFTNAKDAELTADVRIEKEVCAATLKPIVRIYNKGAAPITSATLQSSLNGGAFLPAGSFSGSIAPATSALVAVPPISFSPNATNSVKFKIVNVNGSPDPNPANDTLTVGNILRTTRLAKGRYVAMRFTQDRFGAESTWQIIEEATGTVKLAGGPYPNLNNNGTALRVDSFYADPERCYEVIVNDGSANGINSGAGVGGYQVVSNGSVLYASNGQFGSRDRSTFKTAENLIEPNGINDIASFESSVSLLPNPTAGESNLVFTLARGTKASVQVVDVTGKVVARIAEQNLSAGTHRLPIVTQNLAGGVYTIRLATTEGVVTRRLVVVK